MSEKTLKNYEDIIIKIVTENWRLMKLFIKVSTKLDASETLRFMNQLRYFEKVINDSLEELGFRIENLEGELYDPGMAAIAINIDEFSADDNLFVEQMLEPLILSQDGIKKQAKIKLIKV